MKVESIVQEILDQPDEVITKVVLSQVESQCVLARMLIQYLGRPGIDTDLEMLGSGDEWLIAWTEPKLSVEETTDLMTRLTN